MTVKTPMPDGRETRTLTIPLELRAAGEGESGRTATGYATVFRARTDVCGCWTEEFLPGAFANSLQQRDVLAVHSHDTGRVVGRMKAGTLSLREDDKGLWFENPLPDTTDGRDLAVQIGRGDIAGMSFAFRSRKEEWDETVTPPHRIVMEADLFEITYTAMPQYPETEVGLRSLVHARNEKRQHNRDGAMTRIATRRMRQAQAERGI
jgi:HK97 family phage prohead protease